MSRFAHGLLVIVATLLSTAAAASRAHALTIDDYSVGPIVMTKTGSTAVIAQQTGLDPAHVLGGKRQIIVGEFGAAGQMLTLDAAQGELRFDTPPGVNGYFEIDYGSPSQPLNLDLTANGANSFLMHLAFNPPLGSLPLRPFDYPPNVLRVATGSGTGATTLTTTGVETTLLPDGSYLARIPFSTLTANQTDLTAVRSVEFEMFRLSHQVTLRHFATVPEPAGGWLIAAAGLCARRRRLAST